MEQPDNYLRYRVPEAFNEAKIFVWWDMMSCPLPEMNYLTSIRRNIESALRTMNYRGPATIIAYSTNNIPDDVHAELVNQEIEVRKVEEGEEMGSVLGVDILLHAYRDSTKANYLVITNKKILTRKDLSDRVNVVLFAANGVTGRGHYGRGIFLGGRQISWEWSSLVAGGYPLMTKDIPKTHGWGEEED